MFPKAGKYDEPELNKIYDGIVTKVESFGCIVQLQNFRSRKDGLVHVSNLREGRVNNVYEVVMLK
jgi:polyribonucleotide nucleotidyltransferase